MKKFLLFSLFLLSTFDLFSQNFSGTVGPISDDGQQNDFFINVSGLSSTTLNNSLGLTQVCLDISHPYVADLNVLLIAPNGTTINLFSGIGGEGDNFTNTCLNQNASNTIQSSEAPFTGFFKPQQSLGILNNNQNGNGVWILRIIDTYETDPGVLNSLNLTFGSDAPVPYSFTSSNLPIVVINTNGQEIVDEPSINATMGIIYNGEGTMNLVSDTPNNYNGNILIEVRGNSSQGFPQKPYKIETIDANNDELDVSLLGMPAEHDWVLISNYNDKVFMRNTLAYNLFSNMGHYAVRHKFCEVILNGNYQGIYILMESIKRDNNRVDIAKLDPDENTGNNLTGGYLLKNDNWEDNASWSLNYHPIDHPELDVHLIYEYPKPDVITTQQQTYIQTFINDFETALYGSNFTSTTNGYRNYLDTTSFIDYFIVNELSRNNDGFKKSCFFHKDKNTSTTIAKLKAGPVWDFDWAWKNIDECSIFSATDGSGWAHLINNCGPDNNSTGWHVRLLQDAAFQSELHCRWNNLRTTILSNEYLTNYIDTTAAILQQAQERHFERWGTMGVATDGAPEVESPAQTFAEHIQRFKTWINLRINWLDANMPGDTSNCNLSVNNLQDLIATVTPNPTNDYFTINLPNDSNTIKVTVNIMDITGRKIDSILLENSFQKIDVQHYQKGTYFVEAICNEKSYKSKLIIN